MARIGDNGCMSLNKREQAATSEELGVNLELSGLGVEGLQRDLGMDEERIEAALAVAGADPIDVWLVRDYLERLVVTRGATPRAYSVLTEAARLSALKWFALYDIDDVVKDIAG